MNVVKNNVVRIRTKKTKNNTFFVTKNGNYESIVDFKDRTVLKKAKKVSRKWEIVKNYAPVLNRLLIDIDDSNLKEALEVTRQIMRDELSNYPVNIYFSGNKGFHIEIPTEELDIIDTNASASGKSCPEYTEFLYYFNNKYPQVDTSLKAVGTQPFRRPNTKHEKSGRYKILVDINSSLDEIIKNADDNINMVEPVTTCLSEADAMNLLSTYRKHNKSTNTELVNSKNTAIISNAVNALLDGGYRNRHEIIMRLGSGLNGYISKEELTNVISELRKTELSESNNWENTLIEAFDYDNQPCNLGALRNMFEARDLDMQPFHALSFYLKGKLESKAYNDFNSKLKEYDNDWFKLLENELWDYVDNTENVFKGIIHGVGALSGELRRMLIINGGSEVGKSEYQKTIGKLMPDYIFMGSSTPASMRRNDDSRAYDCKIVGLSDKGLESTSENSQNENNEIWALYGQLVSEGEYIRDLVVGNKVKHFEYYADGLIMLYTKPYEELEGFKVGEQLKTRSTYITVNEVKDGEALILNKKHKGKNPFYKIHQNYIKSIIKNPITINIPDKLNIALYHAVNKSLRTYYYMEALFNAYCRYLQIANPTEQELNEFLTIFNGRRDINPIAFKVYKMLYKHLAIVKEDNEPNLTDSYGNVETDLLIKSRTGRKDKSLFTARKIQTFFSNEFKMNKNLKDVLDEVPTILKSLWKNGYLKRLDKQYNGLNVYYIPYNPDMEK